MITLNVAVMRQLMHQWTDGPKYIISTYLVPGIGINCHGQEETLSTWVKDFPYNIGTIYVVADDKIMYNLRKLRPDLDIRQAPLSFDSENHDVHTDCIST